jgi:adenine-specific DNA-methyltransferase
MNAVLDIDALRTSVASETPPERKSALGQFMTPSQIASFMASMFDSVEGKNVRLLDAGAGIGSLTFAFTEKAKEEAPQSLHCTTWELDPLMVPHLSATLAHCEASISKTGRQFSSEMRSDDFILTAADGVRYGTLPKFTHSILNPPYKKLRNDSEHRKALRKVGVETSNLYTAFVALALYMLDDGGELVAITPRSFCNGSYFKPFREMLLRMSCIVQVHLFDSRNHAFKGDEVLQENIIFRLRKSSRQGDVLLTTSENASFADIKRRTLPFNEMVLDGDSEHIFHLPTGDDHLEVEALSRRFQNTLEDIGIGVSTGPVVDFRLKEHLRPSVDSDCVPLIYCLHFANGYVAHPKENKKANGIAVNAETSKWLMPSGHYVCVRRLSSKEERRRIVPALFEPSRVACEQVGFDNHMNVFHQRKAGIPELIAKGLAVYLSSTLADQWFRRFNGHTQVNAGDLRTLRYPDRDTLESWGARVGAIFPTQEEIDQMVTGSV